MTARAIRWVGVVGLALLPACYTSGSSSDDDGTTDGVREDAGEVVPDDAAPDETTVDTAACTTPQYWLRRTLPIERLEDGSDGPVTAGQTARVLAWVDLGPPGCLELGRVTVEDDPATRVATVLVEGWTNEDALAGMCPPAEPTMVFAALRSPTAGTWTVIDGSAGPAGDPVAMTLEVLPCDAGCGCLTPGPAVPQGGECTWDCECMPGMDCIGYYTMAGETARACHQTCNGDQDCRRYYACTSWDDGPAAICELPTESRCDPAVGCAPGFECRCGDGEGIPCSCVAAMPVDGGPCCRDEDCVAGQDCIRTEASGPSRCAVRCNGYFGCPVGTTAAGCGGGGTPLSGICLPGA